MTDYQKYTNAIKNDILAYERQEDYFMESMKASLAISDAYSELWERAIKVQDPDKRKELMVIVDNVKMAKKVYDLMLNRYQHANAQCARQISYNKALMEYTERLEKEIELSEKELTVETNDTQDPMGQQ